MRKEKTNWLRLPAAKQKGGRELLKPLSPRQRFAFYAPAGSVAAGRGDGLLHEENRGGPGCGGGPIKGH